MAKKTTRKTRSDKGKKRGPRTTASRKKTGGQTFFVPGLGTIDIKLEAIQVPGFGALPLVPIVKSMTPVVMQLLKKAFKSKFVQDLIKDVAVGAAEAFMEKKMKK